MVEQTILEEGIWQQTIYILITLCVGFDGEAKELRAAADFISLWAQHGLPESRDTCESLSGFYLVLGATWAS